MKAVQILTDESIEKIKRAIEVLKLTELIYHSQSAGQSAEDLKAIIADVES